MPQHVSLMSFRLMKKEQLDNYNDRMIKNIIASLLMIVFFLSMPHLITNLNPNIIMALDLCALIGSLILFYFTLHGYLKNTGHTPRNRL